MWCLNPEETIAFMKSVSKPWVAFKVLAAGAIPPSQAFPHSFKNGADFIAVGMFDFQIKADGEDAERRHPPPPEAGAALAGVRSPQSFSGLAVSEGSSWAWWCIPADSTVESTKVRESHPRNSRKIVPTFNSAVGVLKVGGIFVHKSEIGDC